MKIILIGPMNVGKSTVARLLAVRLGIPRHSLDQNRWGYFKEIGFDEDHARQLYETESIEAALHYCKPFEVHAVERHLAEHCDGVIDFGAGYSVQKDPMLQERIRRALAPYLNVILMLPYSDDDASIACLNDRTAENLRGINEEYIRDSVNRSLAKLVVYTHGRTAEETCDDIVRVLLVQ